MEKDKSFLDLNESSVTDNQGVPLHKSFLKTFPWRKAGLIFCGASSFVLFSAGVYYLVKRSPSGQIAAKIISASGTLTAVKPQLLKLPEALGLRLTNISEVKKGTAETLAFLKEMQYNNSFKSLSNLKNSELILAAVYDRMGDLISLQESPDFDPKIMASMERILFMCCRKTLSHLKICNKLESKQLINGLMLLLDKQASKK